MGGLEGLEALCLQGLYCWSYWTVNEFNEPEYAPKREGELLRSVLNNERAKGQIGWEPKYTLDTGLDEWIN